MNAFEKDFAFQARFAPSIRHRVGPFLIGAAPMRIDQSEATDFMIFDARDRRIAARIRRANTARSYWKEITIRSWRSNGTRTEWSKVLEDGFAHWMFYGRQAHRFDYWNLDPWYLLDVDVFRELHVAHGDDLIHERKTNRDGRTGFNVIRPGDLVRRYDRPDLVIAYEFEGYRQQCRLPLAG